MLFRSKQEEGKDYEYIKIKLNTFMKEPYNFNKKYNSDNKNNKDNSDDKDKKVNMVKVFYKNNVNYTGKFKSNRWKNYKLSEIGKVLRAGVKVRFILYVNKLWYNQDRYGLIIKSLQFEIDEPMLDKFQILNTIKNSDKNMFDQDTVPRDDYSEKISDIMKNRNLYGMSRNKISKDNDKIVDIIKSNDKSLFDEIDYVSVHEANRLTVTI